MDEANVDNLDPLTDRYLAGELSEPEAAELLSRMERDPMAGHRLLDQLHIDAMLHGGVDPWRRPRTDRAPPRARRAQGP